MKKILNILFKKTKSEWCKKQREICNQNAKTKIIYFGIGEETIIDSDSILNSPEPE